MIVICAELLNENRLFFNSRNELVLRTCQATKPAVRAKNVALDICTIRAYKTAQRSCTLTRPLVKMKRISGFICFLALITTIICEDDDVLPVSYDISVNDTGRQGGLSGIGNSPNQQTACATYEGKVRSMKLCELLIQLSW